MELAERKILIKSNDYTIFEDGFIDSKVPLTNICYELALSINNAKMETKQNEHI